MTKTDMAKYLGSLINKALKKYLFDYDRVFFE